MIHKNTRRATNYLICIFLVLAILTFQDFFPNIFNDAIFQVAHHDDMETKLTRSFSLKVLGEAKAMQVKKLAFSFLKQFPPTL